MSYNPLLPYDDLPPIPSQADLETKAVFKRCVGASRAIVELKGAGTLIPDQAILINSIPLQEEYLQELERVGALTGEKMGRDFIYRNIRFLELLSS